MNLRRPYLPLVVMVGMVLLAGRLPAEVKGPLAPLWRSKMQPIMPRGYVVRHTAAPIRIDGRLDDPAWAEAPWTSDFVDIQGAGMPTPRFRTRAKLLWDDHYLYIAAQLQEPDVWATLTRHDSVIFNNPDFEVFIDPNGDTHEYYEFEMNALNTSWDLKLDKPYIDGGPARTSWNIPGLKTAVQVQGTLNHPGDVDRGWTLEIAFPWKVLSEYARHPGPPREGEQWRLNFSRVEWRVRVVGGAYQKIPHVPEDNWVWSPQGVVNMHCPEMWGFIQFTRLPPNVPVTVTPLPGKPARDLAIDFYYTQYDFHKQHGRWARSFAELGWSPGPLPAGVDRPVFRPEADGYHFSVSFRDGGRLRTWTIRQDRKLTLH